MRTIDITRSTRELISIYTTQDTRQLLRDHLELTKIRICIMALLMAALGYWLGSKNNGISWGHLTVSLLGIALVGAASGIINQYLERDLDTQMHRTENRPLPAKRLSHRYAIRLGCGIGALGELILLLFVNPVTAVLGALTLFFYLGIYTQAKRVSPISTLIGAIPGALPPLMGWTSSFGIIHWEGLLLFLVVFCWQLPHFLAIGWRYRYDYARAGFPILPVVDATGRDTARKIIIYLLALAVAAALPSWLGVTGTAYLIGTSIATSVFLVSGICLAYFRNTLSAKGVFFVSIAYLPVWAILFVWDLNR